MPAPFTVTGDPTFTSFTENCNEPETPEFNAVFMADTVALRFTELLYDPESAPTAVAVTKPKLAFTDPGAFMVIVCGFVAPLRFPVKPVKAYPALGVAVTDVDQVAPSCGTAHPTHSLAGLMAPPGPALVVR